MLMHIDHIEVMRQGITYLYASDRIKVPFGLERGPSCHLAIGPFEILERIGPVAYRLGQPPRLHRTHNVFHVSVLRHYIPDETHKIHWKDLQVSNEGTFTAEPLHILDHRV